MEYSHKCIMDALLHRDLHTPEEAQKEAEELKSFYERVVPAFKRFVIEWAEQNYCMVRDNVPPPPKNLVDSSKLPSLTQ